MNHNYEISPLSDGVTGSPNGDDVVLDVDYGWKKETCHTRFQHEKKNDAPCSSMEKRTSSGKLCATEKELTCPGTTTTTEGSDCKHGRRSKTSPNIVRWVGLGKKGKHTGELFRSGTGLKCRFQLDFLVPWRTNLSHDFYLTINPFQQDCLYIWSREIYLTDWT